MSKKRGLGRGLDSLLSGSLSNQKTNLDKNISKNKTESSISEKVDDEANKVISHLQIDKLQRGQYQPRQTIADEPLQELANSIAKQGIIQPIVVRQLAAGNYEIIAGERRWHAAKLANLDEVPVIVREVSDSDAIAMSLIENIQRENLNPLEEAQALGRLIEEFELTQQQAADAVGKSRPAVSNMLRLLALSEVVKEMLADGEIEMGHARAMLVLDEAQQLSVAKTVIKQQLSVRETEALIKSIKKPVVKIEKPEIDPNIKHLQQKIEEILGAVVMITPKLDGKGEIKIKYNSLDELDGILEHIK